MYLIVTALVLALLAGLTADAHRAAGEQARMLRYELATVQSRALASSGIDLARSLLDSDPTLSLDTSSDSWQLRDTLTVSISTGRVVLAPREGGAPGEGRPGIQDEESKVGVGRLSDRALRSLPAPTTALHFSATKIDSSATRATALPTLAGTVQLTEDDEVELSRYLTTAAEELNVNTASLRALELSGLASGLCEQIGRFRQGADGTLGTDDDGFFVGPRGLGSQLASRLPLSPAELSGLAQFEEDNAITVSSKIFSIWSTGRTGDGSARATVFALLSRTEGQTAVLDWIEL